MEAIRKNIDKVFEDAAKIVKADAKERLEAIENFYKMPYELMSLSGTNADALRDGAVKEMKRVQNEQKSRVDHELKELDSLLNGLIQNDENLLKVVELTELMETWITKYDKLTILKGRHSDEIKCSASANIIQILNKWKKYCTTEPKIKNAKLYAEKAMLINKIEELNQLIVDNNRIYANLTNELEDRTKNECKYYDEMKATYDKDVEQAENELRIATEDKADLELQLKSLKHELESSGVFAFSKKKDLKIKIEKFENNEIVNAKKLVDKLQSSLNELKSGFESRKEELENRKDKIAEQKKCIEEVLAKTQKELDDNNEKLIAVEKAIKSNT